MLRDSEFSKEENKTKQKGRGKGFVLDRRAKVRFIWTLITTLRSALITSRRERSSLTSPWDFEC